MGGGAAGSVSPACMHSSAHPLLKLQFLRETLPAEQDKLFSIPFRPGLLRTLVDSLKTPDAETGFQVKGTELELPRFEIDVDSVPLCEIGPANSFCQAVRSVLFFHVVRCFPSKLVRVSAADEQGFDSDDIVIAPHRALSVDASGREVVVECSAMDWITHSAKQPFVLSLSNFSCEELLRVFKWSSDDSLSYGVWNSSEAFSWGKGLLAGCGKHLPALLEDLLANHSCDGYELDDRRSEAEHWRPCLLAMESAGLVQKLSEDSRFSKWLLLDAGDKAIKAGYIIRQPAQALQIRDGVDLRDRTQWELIALLDREGWTHMVKSKSKGDANYVPGNSGQKMWYSGPSQESISRWYLLALLLGEHEVSHWQTPGFYQALVEGRPAPARTNKRRLAIQHVDEQDWDVPAALTDAAQTRKRQGPKQRRKALALADVEEGPPAAVAHASDEELAAIANLDMSESEAGSAPASEVAEDNTLTDEAQKLSEEQMPDPDDNPPESPEHAASQSSSSSSSSSSSTSSTEEEARPAAVPGPRASNPRAGFDYAMGHAVRVYKNGVAIGWEMNCGHPAHTDAKCRKNLKEETKQRSSAETVNLLKVWVLRGRRSVSAAEHMKDLWSEVLRDFKNGQLEAAPEDPPMNYTDRDGNARVFTRRPA